MAIKSTALNVTLSENIVILLLEIFKRISELFIYKLKECSNTKITIHLSPTTKLATVKLLN